MSSADCIYADRVITGGITEPLRVSPALISLSGSLITDVHHLQRTEFERWKNTKGQGRNVEDLGDSIVSPAFVNAHTHLCMVAFRGVGGLDSLKGNVVEDLYFRLEKEITAEDVCALSRIGAIEALCSGVGLVWDHYYHGPAIERALTDVGLCGAIATTLQDIAGPGTGLLEESIEHCLSLAERPQLNGIVSVLGPHATDTVSDQLWQRIANLSEQHNLPIHCHIAQSIEEIERSWELHQCSPFQRMHNLGISQLRQHKLWVHALYTSSAELRALPTESNTLGHCPGAQIQFAFPADVHSWRECGKRIALGTDAGSCNDTVNLQAELRLFACGDSYSVPLGEMHQHFRQSGLLESAQAVHAERQMLVEFRAPYISPEKLLESVWSVPGTLHPSAPVGGIEAGRWANLLVWDPHHPVLWPCLDPLQAIVYSNAAPAILRHMSRGQWLFDGNGYLQERIYQAPEVREWVSEASRSLKGILSRSGIG